MTSLSEFDFYKDYTLIEALAELYDFGVINCVENGIIRTIPDINQELYGKVRSLVRK